MEPWSFYCLLGYLMSHVVPMGEGGDGTLCAIDRNIHTHRKMKFYRGGVGVTPKSIFHLLPLHHLSPLHHSTLKILKKKKIKLASQAQSQPQTAPFEKKNWTFVFQCVKFTLLTERLHGRHSIGERVLRGVAWSTIRKMVKRVWSTPSPFPFECRPHRLRVNLTGTQQVSFNQITTVNSRLADTPLLRTLTKLWTKSRFLAEAKEVGLKIHSQYYELSLLRNYGNFCSTNITFLLFGLSIMRSQKTCRPTQQHKIAVCSSLLFGICKTNFKRFFINFQ